MLRSVFLLTEVRKSDAWHVDWGTIAERDVEADTTGTELEPWALGELAGQRCELGLYAAEFLVLDDVGAIESASVGHWIIWDGCSASAVV
jgi:hypothetical protein